MCLYVRMHKVWNSQPYQMYKIVIVNTRISAVNKLFTFLAFKTKVRNNIFANCFGSTGDIHY